MRHPRQADVGADDEALPRAADDPGQCSLGKGPADRIVSRLRAADRARPRNDGGALRVGD
jgi:hypothetical protein